MVLGFRLPRIFAFAQPQLVKLVLAHTATAAGSPRQPFLVFASFVEPQPFNTEFRPYLGSSHTDSNTWVQLAGNLLSSSVRITLQTLSGTAFTRTFPTGLTLTIAVGPAATSYLRPISRPLHQLAAVRHISSTTTTSSSSGSSGSDSEGAPASSTTARLL